MGERAMSRATRWSDGWTRRAALRLFAGSGAAALLSACSNPAPAAPAATTPPAPAAANTPRLGGALRGGVLGDLLGLDGHLTTGLDSLRRVFDVVNVLDAKLNTVPVLAQSLDLSSDARQMSIKVRQGVKFHTGRELTAQDLVWNFNRLKDPKVNPIYANLVKPFATMDTPDAYTLHVEFDAPNPFVVDALPNLVIMDPVTFEQSGVSKPTGTGPYTFVEYVQGDHITLKKNPNYWDTGKPYLDQLEFRIFSDPQAMVAEFEAGSLDVALQPSLVDWARIQKAGTAQALINENSGNYFGMALTRGSRQPMTNWSARHSNSHSIGSASRTPSFWELRNPSHCCGFRPRRHSTPPGIKRTRSILTKLACYWNSPGFPA
jgi:ABC-type transport system substrate-binding protein